MPVYETECPKCGHKEDVIRTISSCTDSNGRFKVPTNKCGVCDIQMLHVITPVAGFVDFPAAGGGYVSPASGKYIDTSKKRKEDFKRTKTRPWEGMKDEKKEAQKRVKAQEDKVDRDLDRSVRQAWQQLPDSKKKILTNNK